MPLGISAAVHLVMAAGEGAAGEDAGLLGVVEDVDAAGLDADVCELVDAEMLLLVLSDEVEVVELVVAVAAGLLLAELEHPVARAATPSTPIAARAATAEVRFMGPTFPGDCVR
ncbi:MAG: hypothetical protein HOV87_21675 [Catenulispora sp.]|nr:hypothetical protein [Catenulispora sp.]